MSHTCPVCIKNINENKTFVKCNKCKDLLHFRCVSLPVKDKEAYKDNTHIKFLCATCTTTIDGNYDFAGALKR